MRSKVKPLKIETTWHCCLVWGFAHRILFNGILCWLIMKFGTNIVKIRFRYSLVLDPKYYEASMCHKAHIQEHFNQLFNFQERVCFVFDLAGLRFVIHRWFFNVQNRWQAYDLKKSFITEWKSFLSVSTCKTSQRLVNTGLFLRWKNWKGLRVTRCIVWNVFSQKQLGEKSIYKQSETTVTQVSRDLIR